MERPPDLYFLADVFTVMIFPSVLCFLRFETACQEEKNRVDHTFFTLWIHLFPCIRKDIQTALIT